MTWPNYQFLDLSKAEKQLRRQTLDKYALYAQLSALVPAVLVLLFRLAKWVIQSREKSKGAYAAVPSSPVLKTRRQSNVGSWSARLRRARWWLGEDVVAFGTVLGQRDQWVVGLLWTSWLLFLSILETGDDYLHLTKRLGLIAVSQWPLQYLLALKSLNPVAHLLRSSHEQVNRWHRVLSRITTTLVCLHVGFYWNFFIRANRLDRLTDPIVLAGMFAFMGLNLLVMTALRPIRRYSYRLFFIIHLVAAILIPLQIMVHAPPAKIFLFESLGVFILDLISRKIDTVTGNATAESIPGTNLVKITASIPESKANRFRTHPGAHIYLSVPAAARKSMDPTSLSHLLFEFLFNPFTVAAVNQENGDLTLVARHCGGPMTSALNRLARASMSGDSSNSANNDAKIPLSIEGPYGAVTRFPQLCSDYDRILLVAGGVGATFTVPLYRFIVSENPGAKVQMVWAIRDAGDATWAVTGKEAEAMLKDRNVDIFLTGDIAYSTGESSGNDAEGEVDAVEMNAMFHDRRQGRYTSQHNRKRPDLKEIVDDLFKHGQEERVAVLVCGPNGMSKELRQHVGVWVKKGRSVWWHKEGFGF